MRPRFDVVYMGAHLEYPQDRELTLFRSHDLDVRGSWVEQTQP